MDDTCWRLTCRVAVAAAILALGGALIIAGKLYDWGLSMSMVSDRLSLVTAVATTVGAFATVVTVIVLAWNVVAALNTSNRATAAKAADVCLDRASHTFKRAFEIFESAVDHTDWRRTDAPKWRAAASMLRSADAFGRRLEQEPHNQAYKVEVDYWRMRFGEVLFDGAGPRLPIEYYRTDPSGIYQRHGQPHIDEESLTTIYRLAYVAWRQPFDPDPFSEWELQQFQADEPQMRLVAQYVYDLRRR